MSIFPDGATYSETVDRQMSENAAADSIKHIIHRLKIHVRCTSEALNGACGIASQSTEKGETTSSLTQDMG